MNGGDLYLQIATWSQVVSAIFFIGVMVYIWMRFLQPMVLAGQERSNEAIAEAERHRDQAKAALEALKGEIEGAHRDAELIRARAERQADGERAAMLAETEQEGGRAVRNAEGELARARDAARVRLRGEILKRALERARDQAEQRIDTAANGRIVERFLATLEQAPR